MHYILYCPTASNELSENKLIQLHRNAQTSNREKNITGLLLNHKQRFIQFIEGNKSDLALVFDKIKQSRLHHQIKVLDSGTCTDRMFPSWSMAYDNLDNTDKGNMLKKAQFEDLFHRSNIVSSPLAVKLKLWTHSQSLFNIGV